MWFTERPPSGLKITPLRLRLGKITSAAELSFLRLGYLQQLTAKAGELFKCLFLTKNVKLTIDQIATYKSVSPMRYKRKKIINNNQSSFILRYVTGLANDNVMLLNEKKLMNKLLQCRNTKTFKISFQTLFFGALF